MTKEYIKGYQNALRDLREKIEKKVQGTGTYMDEFVYLGDIEDSMKELKNLRRGGE